MKKTFVIFAFCSCSLLSANHYYGDYSGVSCPGGNDQYNQNQPYQGRQPYYQNQSNQRNPNYQPNYGQSSYSSNPSYNPSGQQYYENNPDNRNQQRNDRNPQDDRNYANREYDQRTDRNDRNPTNYNTGYISDQDISKKIHDAIGSGWFSSGYENVTFELYNGNVTLKGFVDTLDGKKQVEDEVRKIDGVKQINNQINVNSQKMPYDQRANHASDIEEYKTKFPNDKAMSDSDRVLNAQIRDKLDGWFTREYLMIVLNTSNGVVTVSGTVDNYDDIQKITKAIQETNGVKNVTNRLTEKNK